jgi:urease accessory protein
MTLSSAPESGRTLVRGRLQVEFAATGGRTYISSQYACYPFHICRALYQDPDAPELATLYIQSCSGGLYQDDRLDIGLTADTGAEAHVTTQASTIVHSMPAGRAVQDVRIEARDGAYLEYLPDPQILFPDSRFSSKIAASLSPGATVLLGDAFLMHDPSGGNGMFSTYTSEIAIDDTGTRLALDRLKIDIGTIDVRRAGILGAFGAQGTLMVAMPGRDVAPVLADLRAVDPCGADAAIGVSVLPRSAGLIVRILARDGVTLKRAMHACWSASRNTLKGSVPAPRRK